MTENIQKAVTQMMTMGSMNLLDALQPQKPPRVVGARTVYLCGHPEEVKPVKTYRSMTDAEKAQCVRMRQQGYLLKDIAKKLNVSWSCARRTILRQQKKSGG